MKSFVFALFALLPTTAIAWWKPAPGTSYQIQLNGKLDTSYNVNAYDIDLFDTPAATIASLQQRGIKVICYFSAGTYENWRPDKANFTSDMYGKEMEDWPGEYWLKTSDVNVRAIMINRMKLAKQKDCDAVDPDNVDAAFNEDTGVTITAAQQLDYNRFVATTAHGLDLGVGLKNDLQQVETLSSDFDFAVNEQCVEYAECDTMTPFITKNKAVFGIEYTGDRTRGCITANQLHLDTLYKSRGLQSERYACSHTTTQSSASSDTNDTISTNPNPNPTSSSSSSAPAPKRTKIKSIIALLACNVSVMLYLWDAQA